MQLQLVFLNLIINAVEAMSGMREGPRIRRRSSKHTARPACRGGILDNPAMNRLEMPFSHGALAVAY